MAFNNYFNISNNNNEENYLINQNPSNARIINYFHKHWIYKQSFKSFFKQQQNENFSDFIIPPNTYSVPYQSIPILYEHQTNFNELWNTFDKHSLITNRACLKQLAMMNVNTQTRKCVMELKKVGKSSETNLELDYYVLELHGNIEYFDNKNINYKIGSCVAGMLTNDKSLTPEWTTFRHKSFNLPLNFVKRTSSLPPTFSCDYFETKNNYNNFFQTKSSIRVHYTSEIDAFINKNKNGQMTPVEIKAVYYDWNNNNQEIQPKTAFKAALQCHFAGVNDIVIAFHDRKRIQNVRHYSLKEMEEIALTKNLNVKNAISEAKFLLRQIINEFDERIFNGSMNDSDTLIITKDKDREFGGYSLKFNKN